MPFPLAAFIPLAVPLVKGAIRAAEAAFSGPKQGDAKMKTVVTAVKSLADQLAAAGTLNGPAPDDNSLAAVVETILTDMKADGSIATPSGGQKLGGNCLHVPRGSKVTIEVPQ